MRQESLQKLEQLKSSLKDEKQKFKQAWEDLTKYLGLSFSNWDGNTSTEKLADVKDIYDTTADEAADLMSNGIQGYACGPSSPWFTLIFENETLNANQGLCAALKKAEEQIYKQFAKSGFYDASLSMIQIVVNLATTIMWMEEDLQRNHPVFTVLHPRDCYISENVYGEIDVLFRDFWLTKEQAVEKFGEENLSPEIKNCKNPLQKFQFSNYTGPRSKFGFRDEVKGDKNFISVYWQTDKTDQTVKEDEYAVKPFAVWRFKKALFGDAWGDDCPGLMMRANIKQVNGLCKERTRLAQLVADPPGVKTEGLKVNFVPHGFTSIKQGQMFQMIQPNSNLAWTNEIIKDLQQKIRTAYYVDYFLVLTATIEQRKTATEANGLQEEKAVIMSSFLSRMNSEFFQPVIEWTLKNELEHNRILELSEQLKQYEKLDWKINFISQLAKTQERSSKLNPEIIYAQQIFSLMQVYPEARYKLDFYKFLDNFAKSYGAEDVVVSTSKAKKDYEAVVDAQAQAQANQNRLNNMEQLGNAYKSFADGDRAASESMGA